MSQNPDSKTIAILAEKLGCEDNTTLRNAEGYLRTLKTKSNIKNNIGETAKAVLCLDLAATNAANSINRETAMKLSNLKKTAYLNSLHIIEKILDLDKPLTISEVCVQLSCTVVKDFAEQILKKYREEDEIGRDFAHPQYTAVAVYTACRLKGVKVQKPQLVAMSRLKQSQWKELEQEFSKFAESYFNAERKKKSSNKDDFAKYLEEVANNKDDQNGFSQKDEQDNEEGEKVEDYEVWKKRILEEAYEILGKKGENKSNICV